MSKLVGRASSRAGRDRQEQLARTFAQSAKCQDVVQVEKDGKTINYFLAQNDVSKGAHDPICKRGSSEKVTVTGTVEEKDGKEILTPTKIDVIKS